MKISTTLDKRFYTSLCHVPLNLRKKMYRPYHGLRMQETDFQIINDEQSPWN